MTRSVPAKPTIVAGKLSSSFLAPTSRPSKNALPAFPETVTLSPTEKAPTFRGTAFPSAITRFLQCEMCELQKAAALARHRPLSVRSGSQAGAGAVDQVKPRRSRDVRVGEGLELHLHHREVVALDSEVVLRETAGVKMDAVVHGLVQERVVVLPHVDFDDRSEAHQLIVHGQQR